jgi:elongation factor G
MHDKLHANAVPIQIPIGRESEFHGVVDLISMTAWQWDSDNPDHPPIQSEIPENLEQEAQKYREQMIEAIAECDDEFMLAYLNEGQVEDQQLYAACGRLSLMGICFQSSVVRP